MAHHDEKYLESCASYALGALDGNDLAEFEFHLTTNCEICRKELHSLQETLPRVPASLSQLHMMPELKEKIMFAVRLSEVARADIAEREIQFAEKPPIPLAQPQRTTGQSWLMFGMGFVLIVILVGFAAYVNTLIEKVDQQYAFIQDQETTITKLTTELDKKAAILKILESRNIDVVRMDGMDVNPVGHGKIIWDPVKKVAVLHVSNLPMVPKDKEYQLWLMQKQLVFSAGMFTVANESEKENMFMVKPLDVTEPELVSAFCVTLEPKGGMPQPTGEIYLMGRKVVN